MSIERMDFVIDRVQLQALVEELPQILGSLIASLEPELPHQLSLMRAAMAAGDPEGLATAAHRLRGSLGCIYATASFAAAGILENMGRTGNLTGSDEALTHLEWELNRLKNALALMKKEHLT